jgi:outer membrane lipoprotein-sorting protein
MRWLVALSMLCTVCVAQAADDLPSVLGQLAKVEALSVRFHEEKTMALLATPLASDGTLHYQKPRMLVRHTGKPHASSVLLIGEKLSFGDNAHSQSMDLSSQPALRVLVDTFVSVLGGDLASLQKVATVSLERRTTGYRIRIVPRDDKVKRLVRAMTFDGEGANLSRMELLDANGDTTVTTFSAVELRKPFSAAEQKRLFRVGS